jgi:hypothetical protein
VDARLADNFVDLLPGEPVTVLLESPATLDQLNRALKVVSLTDAVATAGEGPAMNLRAATP